MIRVLQVIEGLNAGGMESMLMNYYRNYNTDVIQYDFLVYSPRAHFDDEVERLGGRIYRITPRGKKPLKNYVELDQFFKKHKEYDIVQVHQGVTYFAPLKYARKNGIKHIIAHTHGMNPSWVKRQGFLFDLYTRPTIEKYATDFIACSDGAAKQIFTKKIYETSNFSIMKNAIDAKQYSFNEEIRKNKRRELQLGDSYVIGHVGNFTYPKNHPFLLDVFSKVLEQKKNAKLVLAGDGVDKEKVIELSKQLGIFENVLFLGNRKDIPELLQAFDVFCFPSFYEGLPVSLVEAQASGLMCLVSDSITKEVEITDRIKYMSLQAKPENWAEALLQPRATRGDMYSHIVQAGYDIQNEAKRMQEYYLSLL